MDVFALRNGVVDDYSDYVRSFITIKDERIQQLVEQELADGALWPDPIVQLNPAFEPGESLEQLVAQGVLHPECQRIFCAKPDPETNLGPLQLHRHQVESVHAAHAGDSYVLTTGTGSGKSLSYIVPIVDHVLRNGSGKGVQAIIVYPMNALANSQLGELRKFLEHGYPQGKPPVTFRRYTGQEKEEERQEIIQNPPDILLTNYVMLELVLTRPKERKLVQAAKGLRFLVFDELHTYRGRQGADVSMLVRRVREACGGDNLQYVGTSATLAGEGSWDEQRQEVAETASQIFGHEVKPERVIGETLKRRTAELDPGDARTAAELKKLVSQRAAGQDLDTEDFLASPLSSWIESTLGLAKEKGSERLVRSNPLPLTGKDSAVERLVAITGVDAETCEETLREALLAGYQLKDERGWPLFAFRLHQFISKGESVYASPEPEDERHVTLQVQRYVPGSGRQKALLPIAFCRECGQEYFVVRRSSEDGRIVYIPRQLNDKLDSDDGEPGFLHIHHTEPWPKDGPELIERLPDAWIEYKDGLPKVRKARLDWLPKEVFLSAAGVEGAGDIRAHYMRAPFHLCMGCGVSYGAHQRSDYGKLATIGSEGRSTATTVLSLSTIRKLKAEKTLPEKARKLLSFTDNRQDASLQAGHFNDFVEIARLRSALFRASADAGSEGLRHDTLTNRVFDALDLPLDLYASNPQVEYAQKEETERALRRVLGYYLYRDLRRGWRVTSPNLEQCGLLDIGYRSLQEFCKDEPKWQQFHGVLAGASQAERVNACKVLLDFMRRELAIRSEYLEAREQESIQLASNQYLVYPWCLDPAEPMEKSRIVYAGSKSEETFKAGRQVFVSARGGFGLFLKRPNTFAGSSVGLKTDDVHQIIQELMEALVIPGLLHKVVEAKNEEQPAGFQLNASAMVWRAGDGSQGFHDDIRVPNPPKTGHRTNPFFVGFYRSGTGDIKRLEAHEHTAQVHAELREEREEKFREAILPILYCSPTMELGVDISQLNVVNMRNVPPTPANYAQRSGRAGRSGQPAFVFTYCSSGSPHDQFFFKRPSLMVCGSVSTPRIDLANEDLLRAHAQAIWLAESGLDLKSSLGDVLDVEGDEPTLALLPHVVTALKDQNTVARARKRALASMSEAVEELVAPEGSVEEWIDRVLQQVPLSFEKACKRWCDLYNAALGQVRRQSKIVLDASRPPQDRERAKRLRNEAESQLMLLLESRSEMQSDFYSYRYFASEGFLPGYNFPRLPLSAYLPGQRLRSGRDEFITRPRFLAVSEFGPRAIIYHEGARYVINKVILPVDNDSASVTTRAVQCEECGYLHPLGDEPAPDLCERCGEALPLPYENLFRMQNVATRRRDRINSDEEERFRLGYEIRSGVRFAHRGGKASELRAVLRDADGDELATLIYGHAATIWRINLGWMRRQKKEQVGYNLDLERGFWAKSQASDDDPDDPMSPKQARVIPFVEDFRNCLTIEPKEKLDVAQMASLQAALKAAIQVQYQLEDRELAAEPLPDGDKRKAVLLYEASEGGAGVLRRLVEDPRALPAVARIGLELCHFDPDTGEDLGMAKNAKEPCEAACYDCLLSYYNQRDHRLVDRHEVAPMLSGWAAAKVETSSGALSRDEQVKRLLRLCDSELEKKWLRLVDKLDLKLPSAAQLYLEQQQVRLDFVYERENTAVFVDGPHHDEQRQKAKDAAQVEALENLGYHVIRFHHAADWSEILRRNPGVFGELKIKVGMRVGQ